MQWPPGVRAASSCMTPLFCGMPAVSSDPSGVWLLCRPVRHMFSSSAINTFSTNGQGAKIEQHTLLLVVNTVTLWVLLDRERRVENFHVLEGFHAVCAAHDYKLEKINLLCTKHTTDGIKMYSKLIKHKADNCGSDRRHQWNFLFDQLTFWKCVAEKLLQLLQLS